MAAKTRVELIRELFELHEDKSPYLDEHWERPVLDRYVSPDIFAREGIGSGADTP